MKKLHIKLLTALSLLFVDAVITFGLASLADSAAAQSSATTRQQFAAVHAALMNHTIFGAENAHIMPPVPAPDTATIHPQQKVTALTKTASAPFFERIKTSQPIIFITIDDGVYDDEAALQLMQQHHVMASLFLNDANIHRHYDFFARWQQAGSIIENHTSLHPHLPQLDAAAQKLQICGNGDRFAQVFDAKPTLFRPPYGEYNATTQQVASQCGIKALVNWSVTVANGQLNYQAPNRQLQPGDIVLLHFTPNLHDDLTTLFAAADAAHLQFGRLEDWLH